MSDRQAGSPALAAAVPRPTPDIALAERLFEELRQRTAAEEGVTRASYGEGEEYAHAMVRREAEGLGLEIAIDSAANLYVTMPGAQRGLPVIIGSHLDSVPRGGNFDGAAGVLMGLAVLAGYRRSGVVPLHDVAVMAIRAEESTWFSSSYIGSRGAFGRLRQEELDTVVRNGDGQLLGACIAACGGDPAALGRGTAHLDPSRIAAFIEPHIEQADVLLERNEPFAIVTGIRGAFRYREARCLGIYAHSGATLREMRRDAVTAGSDLVVAMNALWRNREAMGEDLAVTFGQFATDPLEHAFSKVAGRIDFALDVRSQSQETLASVRRDVDAIVERVARDHKVAFELGPLTETEPALMDPRVMDAFRAAAAARGYSPPLMPCGAGHDAAVFSRMGVPTGMLFIRNRNGSHNPQEHMAIADFAAAADVLSDVCLSGRLWK